MNKFEFTAVTWSSRDSSSAAEAWYDNTWEKHIHTYAKKNLFSTGHIWGEKNSGCGTKYEHKLEGENVKMKRGRQLQGRVDVTSDNLRLTATAAEAASVCGVDAGMWLEAGEGGAVSVVSVAACVRACEIVWARL